MEIIAVLVWQISDGLGIGLIAFAVAAGIGFGVYRFLRFLKLSEHRRPPD